jgi:hypothetical protein
MHLEYYPIRGRGLLGDKFQLARLIDDQGNMYKGVYDQSKHFESEGELKEYLADLLGVEINSLVLSKMSL